MIVPAQAVVAEAIQELREYPPRQKPASFSLDRVLELLRVGAGGEA
jgi:arylsulfatase